MNFATIHTMSIDVKKGMDMGQNETTRGPQVLVHVTTYRVQFWVPIFDPQPYVQRAASIKVVGEDLLLPASIMVLASRSLPPPLTLAGNRVLG